MTAGSDVFPIRSLALGQQLCSLSDIQKKKKTIIREKQAIKKKLIPKVLNRLNNKSASNPPHIQRSLFAISCFLFVYFMLNDVSPRSSTILTQNKKRVEVEKQKRGQDSDIILLDRDTLFGPDGTGRDIGTCTCF